jgi:hypothetical protein
VVQTGIKKPRKAQALRSISIFDLELRLKGYQATLSKRACPLGFLGKVRSNTPSSYLACAAA